MTSELEKKFFDTFGIKPKLNCKKCGAISFALGQCSEVNCKRTYPQITDTMYIDLMHLFVKGDRYNIRVQDGNQGNRIRETLLQLFIDNSKDKRLMVDVQRYFEEQA